LLGLGALFSMIAKYLPSFFSSYKAVTPLLRVWNTCHWSRVNDRSSLRRTTYQFKRRLYGLKILVATEAGEATSYRGVVSFEGNDVIIHAKGLNHLESFTLRMNNPIESQDTRMIGIVLGVDYDRNKFSVVKILSEKKLTETEAIEELRLVTELVPDESALRLRKRTN
jgi:hypothetical protein